MINDLAQHIREIKAEADIEKQKMQNKIDLLEEQLSQLTEKIQDPGKIPTSPVHNPQPKVPNSKQTSQIIEKDKRMTTKGLPTPPNISLQGSKSESFMRLVPDQKPSEKEISKLCNTISISEFNKSQGTTQADIFRHIHRKIENKELYKKIENTHNLLIFLFRNDKRKLFTTEPFIEIMAKNQTELMKDLKDNEGNLDEICLMPRATHLLFSISNSMKESIAKYTQDKDSVEENVKNTISEYLLIISQYYIFKIKYSPDSYEQILNYVSYIKEKQVESHSNREGCSPEDKNVKFKIICYFTDLDELKNIKTSNINKIIIGNVNRIANNCFQGFPALEEVSFSESDTQFNIGVFMNCRELKTISISNLVTSISESTFAKCSSLTTVTIPQSVRIIGKKSFSDCTNLERVLFEGPLELIDDDAFAKCNLLNNIEIPCETIGTGAFSSCKALQNVTFTDNVKVIGKKSFMNCFVLNSIRFPSSVVQIGEASFNCCRVLRSVEFEPNSLVENIGSRAFAYTILEKIKIPSSAKSVGDNAFYECHNLEQITVQSSLEIGQKHGVNTNKTKIINIQ